MMDLRYHLLSLTAVFLALAVGIVVGSSLGSSERQTALVQSLQQRFDRVMAEDRRVQEENRTLRGRLVARETAERQWLPRIIQNKLAGVRLAIIVCGDGFGSEATEALRQALALAGAEVTSVVRLPSTLGQVPAVLREPLGMTAAIGTPAKEERAAARAVTRAVLSGDAGGRLEALARAISVTIEGSYAFPVRRVLLIAAPPAPVEGDDSPTPAATTTERLAGAVLTTAQESGVRIVAAEPEEATGTAFLRTAAEQRLTTIDNIDTVSGQVAFVMALAGDVDGRAGRGAPSALP
jgi:Copper transport outer membrane protein, MctB